MRKFGAKHMCEIVGAKYRRIMVSYQTPVVVVDGENYFVTEEWYSSTTTKHINYFLRQEQAVKIHKVPQVLLQKLVTGEI